MFDVQEYHFVSSLLYEALCAWWFDEKIPEFWDFGDMLGLDLDHETLIT